MITCRPSSSIVRPSSTPLNDFSSETPGPVFFKLHAEVFLHAEVLFYSKVKFASPLICMVKMLKNHFLKMYERLMAKTYNVCLKVVKLFSYNQNFYGFPWAIIIHV